MESLATLTTDYDHKSFAKLAARALFAAWHVFDQFDKTLKNGDTLLVGELNSGRKVMQWQADDF